MGIIGESGAGKSTLLRALLGEVEYGGEAKVFGIDAHSTKQISPFIGYVPQDLSRMYGNFNALENIVAFGRQYGIPDDILIQRGKEILKDLNIDDVANQKVDSLSGGQKRRVSIAIAMVHNPYLLFLDEPTSGLDPLSRYNLWEYLDLINRRYNITLCVISHYLDEIEYCDSACIFLRNVGFYDWDTPIGLKKKLPGKGLAMEVTLEKVTVEALEQLRKLPEVDFVIQRGERFRILSNAPTVALSQKVMKVLESHNMAIHSLENKVQIDVIDYFTYVSTLQKETETDIPIVFSNKDYDVKNVTERANEIAFHKPKKDEEKK
jgi:ABC-type multidrug transport system ATPase subunit